MAVIASISTAGVVVYATVYINTIGFTTSNLGFGWYATAVASGLMVVFDVVNVYWVFQRCTYFQPIQVFIIVILSKQISFNRIF